MWAICIATLAQFDQFWVLLIIECLKKIDIDIEIENDISLSAIYFRSMMKHVNRRQCPTEVAKASWHLHPCKKSPYTR